MPITFVPVTEGEFIDNDTESFLVGPSCSENMGEWYCIDCARSFRNNIEKDGHANSGTHRLAWSCFVHGMETP